MFYAYSIRVDGLPVYYGSGSDDYGDGRGRIDYHKVMLQAAISGTPVRQAHLYGVLAEKQTNGHRIEFVVEQTYTTELEAQRAECTLIAEHVSKHANSPLINRKIDGRVIRQSYYQRLVDSAIPSDGVAQWKYKHKLYLAAKSATRAGFLELADALLDKKKNISITDTEKVNATLAVQRATRLALRKGYHDVADKLSIQRASEMALKDHRRNAKYALEEIKVRDLLSLPVPADAEKRQDYLERLVYQENRLSGMGLFVLAEKVTKRLYDLRSRVTVNGVKASKKNQGIIARLRAEPNLLAMPYTKLSRVLGVPWENLARIIRLAGMSKLNAATVAREAKKKKLSEDPNLRTSTIRELMARHGLSRMSVIRYLGELSVSSGDDAKVVPACPEPEKVEEPDMPVERLQPQVTRFRPRPIRSAPQTVPTRSDGKCHQRVIRETTLEEDLRMLGHLAADVPNMKASDFVLGTEDFSDEHRDFIRRYEWLGNCGQGIKWCFAARYAGILGGVVLLSEPYYPSRDTALIARGACAGWTPKNLGSRMIMHACHWMAENTEKRKFVAYADAEAGEIGQIYQACNFRFLGFKKTSYGVTETGERRSFQALKRTAYMLRWLKEQDIDLPASCFTKKGYLRWSQIPLGVKSRMRAHIADRRAELMVRTIQRGSYILALGKNKGETRKLQATLPPAVPYPKRS